jgi:hypothetical protein
MRALEPVAAPVSAPPARAVAASVYPPAAPGQKSEMPADVKARIEQNKAAALRKKADRERAATMAARQAAGGNQQAPALASARGKPVVINLANVENAGKWLDKS